MQVSDFSFELPNQLIARYPTAERRGSRLMVVEGDCAQPQIKHQNFPDFLTYLHKGDLLVFNNTKVIPARLYGHKSTGGKVEVLIERPVSSHSALAHIKASKAPKAGTQLLLEGAIQVQCTGRQGALFELEFLNPQPLVELLEAYGHLPLPPYLGRNDEPGDRQRYQTVYAQHAGAVAAPTAGLHFDEQLLQQIQALGVNLAFVTLHVGAGTFQPVKTQYLADHVMHKEWLEVSPEVAAQVNATKAAGGRVIAVGTTSVRCLETATSDGVTQAFSGDTDIFIYPGYQWRCVDKLLTNFHLPESTLLMLVSSFAGQKPIQQAYQAAIAAEYRFFSYGDAMLLTRLAS